MNDSKHNKPGCIRANSIRPRPAVQTAAGALAERWVSFDAAPYSITVAEFRSLQSLIYRESGMWLSETKSALLTCRLSKRMRALGFDSFSQYCDRVSTDPEELRTMLDAITTNETQFFREPAHFHFLDRHVLPAWQLEATEGRRPKAIRVWSAGCSTGQEAYSLAMLLIDRLQLTQGWSVEILATDLSRRVLKIADEGVWEASKGTDIPPDYMRAFMLKGLGENEGKIKAAPSIRIIRFLRLNLNDASYPRIGEFDLIFCRNVLIYFDPESRKRTIGRLLSHLAPSGYLFVGHAESLNLTWPSLQCVIPTVYLQTDKGDTAQAARNLRQGNASQKHR